MFEKKKREIILIVTFSLSSPLSSLLNSLKTCEGGGRGGNPYNGLYEKAPPDPKGVPFSTLYHAKGWRNVRSFTNSRSVLVTVMINQTVNRT